MSKRQRIGHQTELAVTDFVWLRSELKKFIVVSRVVTCPGVPPVADDMNVRIGTYVNVWHGCGGFIRCQQYVILDHAFYDEKALSLLLLEAGGDKGQPALVLLPTAPSTEADEWSTCCKISLSSPCERFLIDKLW